MNNSQHDVLRFITAGSVDDGKSTLIGRLLFDSQAVLADQLSTLARAKNKRSVVQAGGEHAGQEIDLALLTDGLEAEREQGITIDIAYRYFATAQRKFIIADAPGHEQYTRNMVTGASTAHAAIVLIDATRVTFENDQAVLLAQTKRHSAIINLLNLQHVIVAVNKMDLVNFDEAQYQKICASYTKLATQLGLKNVHYVPVSALRGDNIVNPSAQMPWYAGLPLLSTLEHLPLAQAVATTPQALRFPVQLVTRQDGTAADDFRGYMGRVEAGSVNVGQEVQILPSGHSAKVTEILHSQTATEGTAQVGDNITLRLDSDVDISRGDTIVALDTAYQAAQKLRAELCWFDEVALNTSRKYVLKMGPTSVNARISQIENVLDVHTLENQADGTVHSIKMNDIGMVHINLQQPLAYLKYAENKAAGAFILIDAATHHTVAAGMVQ